MRALPNFTKQLLAPSCARALDALGDRLSLRTDLLDRFFVLRRVCETVCERAAALPPIEEDGLREAAHMLRARLDFAVQAERAKADAADVAAEIAVDAVERRRRERRFGAVGASTDEALEVNGRTWRLVPPFPTEDDIPLVDKANEPSVARGPAAEGDNAAGGMAPVLAPRPVQPHNRAVGAFPSLAAYLSTHYFLTREDCLAALRAGVLAQRELREQGNENAARGGLPVYRDACAVGLAFSRRGVGWRLRFSLGGKPGGRRKSVQSSRLMTGSLLCLAEASDNAWSRPIFAVVADAEPRFDPSLSYTMVESTAYFESTSADPTAMPFVANLLCTSTNVPPPTYLRFGGRAPRMHLNAAFPGNDAVHAAQPGGVDVLAKPWPELAHTLDQSQFAAIQLAMRHSIALIQSFQRAPALQSAPRTREQLLKHVSGFEKGIALERFTLWSWCDREKGGAKSKDSKRIGFETFRVIEAQKQAQRQIERGLEASSCTELTLKIVNGHVYFEAAPWALEQVLLAKQHHSVPQTADADGFTLVVDKKAQKRRAKHFADVPAKPAEDEGDSSDEDEDGLGGAQRQAEAEEAAEIERERRAELGGEGEREQGGEAFNLRAMEAALAAAAAGGGNDEGGPHPAPVPTPGDEGEFSDDDESGGGPARAAARRGQVMLSEAQLCDVTDVWSLSLRNRRALHSLWADTLQAHGHALVLRCLAEYRGLARVIGFTTTGAAKYRSLLEAVAPAVLIVEEAAEVLTVRKHPRAQVLEAHVLAAIVPSIQHMILIGEHQQLRPKVESWDLAQRHQLAVSMFERLVSNGLPRVTLTTQHRMRPEFSRLLRPAIYRELHDAPCTHGRPPTSAADRGGFGGFVNEHEATMIVGQLDYHLRNGVLPAQIVVLAAYQSQATVIRARIAERTAAVRKAIDLGGGGSILGLGALLTEASEKRGLPTVRVSTIDNYQDEEAEIVLLSLVRSTPTAAGNFNGFMREPNRVCVAFSRARSSFYIFGNAELHRSIRVLTAAGADRAASRLWIDLVDQLRNASELGPELPLACHTHLDRQADVRTPTDWESVASGGCSLPCETRLECGLACSQKCHSDGHQHLKCTRRCERARETCAHPCARLCYEACGSCMVPVVGVVPGCGHKLTCVCVIKWLVPSCPRGHTAELLCGSTEAPGICVSACGEKLACGHDCSARCSDCPFVPGPGGQAHSPCLYACSRRLLCGHDCRVKHPCSEACPPCTRPCETRCEHSKCDKQCFVPRDVACAKPSPCGLHPYIGLYGEPCPTVCRECHPGYVDTISLETLGEAAADGRFVQLQDCTHTFEMDGLDLWMATQDVLPREEGDPAAATTGADGGANGAAQGSRAVQLPMCPNCRVPVRRSFRYGATVRRCALQIEEVKRRAYVGLEGRTSRLAQLRPATDGRPPAQVLRAISTLLGELAKRARMDSSASVVQLMLGELHLKRASLLPPPPPETAATPEAATAPKAAAARAEACVHLEEALRLAGYTPTGTALAMTIAASSSSLTLSPRQRAVVAHLALTQLGLVLARIEGMEHAARLWLEAAQALSLLAGVEAELDVDAALRDVAAAKAAIANCGGAVTTGRCPDCRAIVGDTGHQLAPGNRAMEESPWARMQAEEPAQDFIEHVQRGELDGGGH
ncbi:hypothetical protein T492DRAFT_870070 [Pavlovales sp. CCMP2436]|nr:hypothetical protein T492DRAFT_870070 [Pavlovales sp. CCMP2436]